jgi:hypothetical protein
VRRRRTRPSQPRRAVERALLALLVLAAALVVVLARDQRGDDLAEAAPSTTTTAPTTTNTLPTTTAPPPPPSTVPFDPWALVPPNAAGDPAGLAAQILAAENALRDPATTPEAFANAALHQQVAYRMLGNHPEWDGTILAAIPPELHAAVTRHAAARRQFRAMHRSLSTTLPGWTIVPPAPVEELQAYYVEAGAAFGVPWQYLAAINLVETGMGRIRGTSSAGAQGPMQFMPRTWEAFGGGGDINSVRDSIFAAARYLAHNGGGANISNALWNYNHSDHYVLGVMLYADIITEHPNTLRALHLWGVWYLTAAGDKYLNVGYSQPAPVPV